VALPNVVGKVQAIAEKELTTAGFVPKSDRTAASTAEEKGTVLEQDPSGSKAAKGSTITLTIGAGPDTQTVPNLKGMTQDEARKALEERGLAVGNVTSEDDPEIEKDGVISSSPAAGDTVESGTSVSLVLSTGKVTVPNLIGQSPEAAHRTLTDLKLRYKDVLKESSKPAGTVIAQDETGSTKQKTRVTLTIAKPKTATTTAPTTPAPTTTSPSPSSSPSDEPT
jgi:serine/threonine-protein kinase